MRPGFFQNNSANMGLAHAIQLSEFGLGKPGRADMLDIFSGKLCVVMIFTFCIVCAVSAFLHHVPNIIGMGPHGEMFGINARGVVTRMHDLHIFGDHSLVFNHPRNTVSHVHSSPVRDSKKALAPFVLGSYPQPTIIRSRFLNLIPKTLQKAFIKHEGNIHERTGISTKLPGRLRYAATG